MTIHDWALTENQAYRHSNAGYTRFCEALDDNRLTAGMTLTQSQLSKILGISISPLRETLVLLEEYGLVEIKPRAGVRIFYPDMSFIRENMQFRSMIEISAMPVFVRNVTEEWMKDIKAKHVELQGHWRAFKGERDENLQILSQFLDRLFHEGIVETVGNKSIHDAHQRARENVHIARKVHQTSFGKSHYLDTIDEHLKVLNAVEAGNTALAIVALEEHFRAATHRIFIEP